MPTNPQIQGRLERSVAAVVRQANLELDTSAQDHVGVLIATAADRMEQEDRLDDEEAIKEAERAFGTLLRKLAIDNRRGEERRSAFESQATVKLSRFQVDAALRGICPLWPIC